MKTDTATVQVVAYEVLQEFLADTLGLPHFEILEARNDSDHYFQGVGDGTYGLSKWDLEYIERAKRDASIEVWALRPVLEALAATGKIEPGNYLLRVSW